jgi:Tfp pilus assembly protein PilX
MKLGITNNPQQADRKGERGAALLTTLLISMLVLAAGMALVTSTSLSTTTSIDAAAEMQAYSAAEAGLDATLNVIRGNIAPHSSLVGTTMNFRTAAHPALANKTSDPLATGTSAKARMSGWLNYSYQNGADWRVPLTSSYAPQTGIAYKIEISDPDDVGPIATRKITTQASYIPTRVLVRAEGYGPKGAVKRLEMIVTGAGADIKTPGAITMAGSPISLDLGNSAVVNYSGNDMATPAAAPVSAVAVTAGNEAAAQTAIDGMHSDGQVQPNTPGTISAANSADFLRSADAARNFLNIKRGEASGAGRLFSTKAEALAAGGLGTTTAPKFTFIDNYNGSPVDLGSNHQGSGLLIVTGDLETNGNTDFEGIILVLGKGKISRSGGGNGVIRGTIMVANFDPNGAFGTPFGSPSFSINGGGTSTIGYDSAWIRKALDTLGLAIVGVREYH